MARLGRRFPAGASPFVGAQLQVPLVGAANVTLPTPLTLVAQGNQGLVGTANVVLPSPLTLQGSGGPGSGLTAVASVTLPTPLQLAGLGTVGSNAPVPTGLYSSSDLLRRVKFYAQRPAVDESMADSDWLSLLTEAHGFWVERIAAIAPAALYGRPQLLQTPDNGLSYTFGVDADGNQIFPIGHVELRESPFGREMLSAAEYDNGGDFVMNGNIIIFPAQRARVFGNGPWARFVTPGGTIDVSGNREPIIQPQRARMLMVWTALVNWATRGGFRDSSPFQAQEDKLWYGNPQGGDVGLLGMYKTQYMTQGAEAIGGNRGAWWDGLNTGSGYSKV